MKDCNECVNFSSKMDKKIYKNLSFFSKSSKYFLIELPQNFHWERHIDSV